MKKLIISLLVMICLAFSVFAGTKITLTPYESEMQPSDVKEVTVCITQIKDGVETPRVGVPLEVLNLGGIGFEVAVKNSPTDASGCGTIELKTTAAATGTYSFVVNGMKGDYVLVGAQGAAKTIPEFTTIGAGIALLGAGAIYFSRKKR